MFHSLLFSSFVFCSSSFKALDLVKLNRIPETSEFRNALAIVTDLNLRDKSRIGLIVFVSKPPSLSFKSISAKRENVDIWAEGNEMIENSSVADIEWVGNIVELLKMNPQLLYTNSRLLGGLINERFGRSQLLEIVQNNPELASMCLAWNEWVDLDLLKPISPEPSAVYLPELALFARMDEESNMPMAEYEQIEVDCHFDPPSISQRVRDYMSEKFKSLFESEFQSVYAEINGALLVKVRINDIWYWMKIDTGSHNTWVSEQAASESLNNQWFKGNGIDVYGKGSVNMKFTAGMIGIGGHTIFTKIGVAENSESLFADSNGGKKIQGILGFSLNEESLARNFSRFTMVPLRYAEYEYLGTDLNSSMKFSTSETRFVLNEEYVGGCEDYKFHYMPVIAENAWVVEVELVFDDRFKIKLKALFDTGASLSTIDSKVFKKIAGAASKVFPSKPTKIGIQIPIGGTESAVFEHAYDEAKYFALSQEGLYKKLGYHMIVGVNFMVHFPLLFDRERRLIGICKRNFIPYRLK
jgi:Eukaryotic aspartyl protease